MAGHAVALSTRARPSYKAGVSPRGAAIASVILALVACKDPDRSVAPSRKELSVRARVVHNDRVPQVRVEVEAPPGAGISSDRVRRAVLERVRIDGVNPMQDHVRGLLEPPLGWEPEALFPIATAEGPGPAVTSLVDRSVERNVTYAYRARWIGPDERVTSSPIVAVRVHDPETWWHTDEVARRIDALLAEHGPAIQQEVIGHGARRGLPIVALRAGSPRQDAPTLVVTGCIHAGESGPELLVPAIGALVSRAKTDRELASALDRVALLVVPVINVDERDRLLAGHPTYLRTSPQGIDLNRNFPTGWDEISTSYGTTSADPASSTFRGAEPLSAIEARALYDALARVRIGALLSYHWIYSLSGAQLEQPRAIASASPALRARQDGLARAWFSGLDRKPYPQPVKHPILDTSPGGSLVTWVVLGRDAPAFEVEGAGDPRLEALRQTPPTKELLAEYTERHADALRSVLVWLASER